MSEKDNPSTLRQLLEKARLTAEDDLNAFMRRIAVSHNQIFRRRDSQSKQNLKNDTRKSANDLIQYRYVTFQCYYGQERMSESSGKRESR